MSHRGGRGGSFSSRSQGRNQPPPGAIGRDELEKYKGLGFSEKDWKCTVCGNINWARRLQCNTCQTSKPGTETAEGSRQGRGGGFMEREAVVEYKRGDRNDDDDLWDEFGRRKTKKQTPNKRNVDGFAVEETKKPREDRNVNEGRGGDEGEGEGGDDEDEDEDDDRWAAWDDIISGPEKAASSKEDVDLPTPVDGIPKGTEEENEGDPNHRKAGEQETEQRDVGGGPVRSRSPEQYSSRSRSRQRSSNSESPSRRSGPPRSSTSGRRDVKPSRSRSRSPSRRSYGSRTRQRSHSQSISPTPVRRSRRSPSPRSSRRTSRSSSRGRSPYSRSPSPPVASLGRDKGKGRGPPEPSPPQHDLSPTVAAPYNQVVRSPTQTGGVFVGDYGQDLGDDFLDKNSMSPSGKTHFTTPTSSRTIAIPKRPSRRAQKFPGQWGPIDLPFKIFEDPPSPPRNKRPHAAADEAPRKRPALTKLEIRDHQFRSLPKRAQRENQGGEEENAAAPHVNLLAALVAAQGGGTGDEEALALAIALSE